MKNWKDYLSYSKSSVKTITKILFVITVVSFTPLSAKGEPDSLSTVQRDTSAFVMQKSPWGAVLRSALIPGLGQFYNESYWKIPIVWGFVGYFGYLWNDNNNKYADYRDLYNKSVTDGNGNLNYLRLREFYRDQRDQLAVYLGLTYLLNLIDAYVDAQLFDFNVTDDFMGVHTITLKIRL